MTRYGSKKCIAHHGGDTHQFGMLDRFARDHHQLILEQWPEWLQALGIHVGIHATEPIYNQDTRNVSPENAVRKGIVCFQKIRIAFFHQGPVIVIGPQAILPFGVMFLPGCLGYLPLVRDLIVPPGLMDDSWYHRLHS